MRLKLVLAGIAGFLAVALAAFGAHALPDSLPDTRREAFESAGRFHLAHAVLLAGLALAPSNRTRTWAFFCVLAGTVLFCGALYAYALTGASAVTMAAPVGGVSFMAGWLLLAFSGAAKIASVDAD